MRHARRRRRRRRSAAAPLLERAEKEDYASLVTRPRTGLPFELHHDEPEPDDHVGGSDDDPSDGFPEGSAPPLPDLTPEELVVNAAGGAARRGEFDRAIAIYMELLDGQPEHLEARHALALLLEQAGRGEEAIEALDRCLDLAPDDPRFLTARGAVLCGLRRFAEADADLSRSLEADPSSVDTHFHYGVLQSRKGLWGDALPYLRRSVELDPGCAAAYLHLGDVLNHLDELPGALEAYQRSVELGPSNAKALYGLGVVYDRLNQPDEARTMYRRSRELAAT